MLRTVIDSAVESLPSYGDLWETMFADSAHEPSTSFEWTSALCANHLTSTDKFYVLKISAGKNIQCLVPLVARRTKAGPLPFVELFPIAELYNTHSDLLTCSQQQEIYHTFIQCLFSLDLRWDMFRMGRLLEHHPLLNALEEYTLNRRVRHRIRYEQPSFFLPLPATFDEYLLARSAKFRNHLRRKQKKIKNNKNIQYLRLTDLAELDRWYDDMLIIEAGSWKHGHGTAISAIERQTGFYKELCRGALRNNRLHLVVMYDGKTPIAYNLGYVVNDTYFYLKTSYDKEYQPWSPATLLRAFLIESLIAEKMTLFDFPGEPYAWEQQWTRELRWHKSLVMFNNTMPATALRFLMRLRDRLKGHKDRKDLRFCDPKALRPSAADRSGHD
jgi:CelD/BcsL family acetyltransferase involved in cellulose biosynthesis